MSASNLSSQGGRRASPPDMALFNTLSALAAARKKADAEQSHRPAQEKSSLASSRALSQSIPPTEAQTQLLTHEAKRNAHVASRLEEKGRLELSIDQLEIRKIQCSNSSSSSARTEQIAIERQLSDARSELEKINREIGITRKLTSNRQQRNETPRRAVPEDDANKTDNAPVDHRTLIESSAETLLEKLNLLLETRKATLAEAQDIDQIKAIDKHITVLSSSLVGIAKLQEKLSANGGSRLVRPGSDLIDKVDDGNISGDSHDNDDPHIASFNKDERSDFTTLITRRTTTKRRPVERKSSSKKRLAPESVAKVSTTAALQAPDDINNYLSKKDRKRIIKIDNRILDLTDELNGLLKEINQVKKELKEKISLSKKGIRYISPEILNTLTTQLQKLEYLYFQKCSAIGKLYQMRDRVGKHFLSPPAKEAPDTPLIKDAISEKTRQLEATYKSKLDTYVTKVNSDRHVKFKSSLWNLAGGGAAFLSSFFWANTIGRLVPTWFNWALTPSIAGFLHTTAGTASAKQFMLRSWRSPALAELNNYFRLLGAYWHDRRTGQLDEKKYVSKDPNIKEKLTIKQRWAEERSLKDIFLDRYKSEEAPYFSYTLLYSMKGIQEGLIFTAAKTPPSTRNTMDIFLHGIAGVAAGALYLDRQQDVRSQRPGNTVDVLPTPDIWAAKADWLSSLRDDLDAKIQSLKAVNPTDPHIRHLMTKRHATDVALLTAIAKSGRLSAWKQDFLSQFTPEVIAETLTDIIGRIISLYPVAAINYLTAGWRNSGNPLLIALGHVVPAVALIFAGSGGFQARGLYGGILLAVVQSVMGTGKPATADKDAQLALRKQEADQSEVITLSPSDEESTADSTTTQARRQARAQAEAETEGDDSKRVTVTSSEDETRRTSNAGIGAYDDSEVITSSDSDGDSDDARHDVDRSERVTLSDSDLDSIDVPEAEKWEGQPLRRDEELV